jgi:hypothetical protein
MPKLQTVFVLVVIFLAGSLAVICSDFHFLYIILMCVSFKSFITFAHVISREGGGSVLNLHRVGQCFPHFALVT